MICLGGGFSNSSRIILMMRLTGVYCSITVPPKNQSSLQNFTVKSVILYIESCPSLFPGYFHRCLPSRLINWNCLSNSLPLLFNCYKKGRPCIDMGSHTWGMSYCIHSLLICGIYPSGIMWYSLSLAFRVLQVLRPSLKSFLIP